MITGLTTYAYLVLTARAVGPERYAAVSVLWAITVLAGLGFFIPVEQEVARAISMRRARGAGSRPVVQRATVAATGLASLLVLVTLAVSGPLRQEMFDGSWVLLLSFAGSLVAYGGVHVTRGVLSGSGRFTGYGLLLALEGVFRLAGCLALVVAGVDRPGPYGLVLAVAPALAVAVVLRVERNLLTAGPPASFSELATSLGHLLAGSVLAQVLVNGPPLAVKVLAERREQAAAGRFLASLIVARIPLFLFAAVQAALLPRLSALVAEGRGAEFRTALGRLLLLVGAVAAAATVGAVTVGRPVVNLLFGSGFTLRSLDLGLLGGASGVYLVALVLAQALISIGAQARATLGWGVGVVAFAAAIAVPGTLVTRVEMAFLAGAAAAAVALAVLLVPQLPEAGAHLEALVEPPLVVDPIEP